MDEMVRFSIGCLIIVASSIWVLIDAKRIGVKKGQLTGAYGRLGPWGWFFNCLLLWLIAFPIYLSKRGDYKRVNGKAGGRARAIVVAAVVIGLLIVSVASEEIVVALTHITSGGPSQTAKTAAPKVQALANDSAVTPVKSEDPAVNALKNAVLTLDKSTTFGRAFDNYKYFERTEWRVFRDPNGRTTVRARGVFDYKKCFPESEDRETVTSLSNNSEFSITIGFVVNLDGSVQFRSWNPSVICKRGGASDVWQDAYGWDDSAKGVIGALYEQSYGGPSVDKLLKEADSACRTVASEPGPKASEGTEKPG